jgi:hypothetical protein
MPAFLRRKNTVFRKAKTPASFLTGVLKNGRLGKACAWPRALCPGLSVLRVVDSRTWHCRSFPEKWVAKIDEVRFCVNLNFHVKQFMNLFSSVLFSVQ